MTKWRIANHNPKTLKNIVILTYEILRRFHTKIQFTGNSYRESIWDEIFDLSFYDPRNNISYVMKIMSERLGFL
jgi:hypothetical protein